ncbi:MAG: hypothetical protein EOO68_27365 [Moraxellaceae bacterium]|nr:MAG: hypothetical protein EOO68_27365 [Moraxellaceae bacterium]
MENSARLPAHEWVINCQRLESNELKSSRNTRVKLPLEELFDELDEELVELLEEELDELLEEELDELLLVEEVELDELELEELELLLGEVPPHDKSGAISSAIKIWIKGSLRITGSCIFYLFVFCTAPDRHYLNGWRDLRVWLRKNGV